MSKTPKRLREEIRAQHNNELLHKMRKGESLTSFDSQASWYPPRPVIKKDLKEMKRLYKDSDTNLESQFDESGKHPENKNDNLTKPLNMITGDVG